MPAIATQALAGRIDCAAVNKGALNVDLKAHASVVREVTLEAGETVIFKSEGSDPGGSLTLVAGPGSPRPLLTDKAGSAGAYQAARDGTFAFRFAREGDAATTFTATCAPAGATPTNTRHRAGKAGPERWASLPALPETEMPDIETDPDSVGTVLGNASPPASSPPPGIAAAPKTAPKATTGLDTRLKWEGNSKEPRTPPANAVHIGEAAEARTLGVKYKLQPQIMIGVLAQLDQGANPAFGTPGGPSPQPWMAGPVATIQLAPGLALDARAAWGAGETSLADRLSGISGTERRLIDAKLASNQSFGPWRFSPSVTLNYFEEKPVGTTAVPHDATVPRATTGAGRIDVTPELAYRIEMPQAMYVEPKAVIGSFWGIDDLSKLAPHGAAHEDMRLKAGAGVTVGSTGGTKLQVGGGVEGGGAAAPDVWSGRLQLSVPLK